MVETATPPRSVSSVHEPAVAVAPVIRRRVRALLTAWDLDADSVDDALLVIEELVANVLDHARTPFRLDVRLSGDVLHVAVRDRSGRSPRIRPFDPHAARGRGLQMVASLSQDWGCEQHADGKTVWADLRVA